MPCGYPGTLSVAFAFADAVAGSAYHERSRSPLKHQA